MPILRLASPADAPAIAALYRPIVEETAISFELAAPEASEVARRIAAVLELHPYLVCAAEDELWGYAYATAFRAREAYRWSAETTVYVHAERRRRGVARALMRALLGSLRLQGFRRAVAGIALPNDASVALHESLGFRPVGVFEEVGRKLGAWQAVGFWDLALADGCGQPRPPRPVREVCNTPGWRAELAAGEELQPR